jgi:hypothetical protein
MSDVADRLRRQIVNRAGNRCEYFHPRRQHWSRHFRWEGMTIVGSSPTGLATVHLLDMNRPLILAIRLEESLRGRLT